MTKFHQKHPSPQIQHQGSLLGSHHQDNIPSAEDDSEDDDQQIGGSVVASKKDKLLGRPATVDEIWMQSHKKKGTRPLDKLLISKGGEGPQEARNLDDIDLHAIVKWKSYKEHVKKRYGDDASKQPLFDPDSWIQAVGGRKKGRVYGFSDISDSFRML
ncbi:hypothetical protein R6Q59_027947 [Mikania micrantha]